MILRCLALFTASLAFAAGPDVLIVYDASRPYKTVAPAADDAVTGASAASINCRIAAERLGAALEARNLTVRLVPVSEIRDYRELLEPRMLVLGSPVRFSNVSWQMKKLFDDHFYRIYTSARQEFATRRLAAFAVGEVEPAAQAALDSMRSATHDCGGTLGATLVLLTGSSRTEAERDIRQFTGTLAGALHE